jgi:kexin
VDLPTPKLSDDTHGTRCAGEIAAGKNEACGVGIAYESKIAGIRILSGPISDIDEAAALNYAFQNTSIYSCSWGPTDDGRSMEGPGYLVEKAFVNGIYNGRDGKGSVFVFASGNGAWSDDQCNFDGFTNSIYSITVGSIDSHNKHPQYSEACAANIVVTYSSGSGKSIVSEPPTVWFLRIDPYVQTTTDVARDGSGHKCTSSHSGTSAAAPNAAGVFALALGERPDLTWRDMQYLITRTAVQVNPDDKDWEKTAQGRYFSYKYGFGLLDGYRYVMAAKDWKLVKPQAWLELPYVQINNGTMDLEDKMTGGQNITEQGVTSSIDITKDMLTQGNFESLEHVTVKVWISHKRRGDVEVEIVSPAGVKSVLAAKRKYDTANSGYPGWRFMSVKHWCVTFFKIAYVGLTAI